MISVVVVKEWNCKLDIFDLIQGGYIRQISSKVYSSRSVVNRTKFPSHSNSQRNGSRRKVVEISTVQRFSKGKVKIRKYFYKCRIQNY